MPRQKLVRSAIIVLAVVAASVEAAWLAGVVRDAALATDQRLFFVARIFAWEAEHGWIVAPFYTIACSAGVLASLLAIALSLRSDVNRYSADIGTALAAGSAAFAWVFCVRTFDAYGVTARVGAPWVIALDVAATALAGLAIVRFLAFLSRYPTEVSLDEILWRRYADYVGPRLQTSWLWRSMRAGDERFVRFCALMIAWGTRWRWPRIVRWYTIQSALTRARLGYELDDSESAAVAQAQDWQRKALTGRFATLACVALGAAAGIAWRLDAAGDAHRLLTGIPVTLSVYAMALAAYSMLDKHRSGLAEHRVQIEWILWGVVTGILVLAVPAVLVLLLVPIADHLGWLGWVDAQTVVFVLRTCAASGSASLVAIVVLSIALSVFYRGSIDPRLALKRTTVYSLLALVLTALFVALEGAASASVVTALGMSSQAAALLAGTIVALAFGPVRHHVQKRVERIIDDWRPAELLAEGRRHEAAVLFSDLSGYTALSERDEKSALTLVALFHKEARSAAEAHGGRLVKTIGDATLTVFSDSAAAVGALARLHRRYASGTTLLELPALPIHSGLHVGEIVEAPDGDVFGATVNLAARLQGEAKGGEAVLSEAAARGVGVELRALGERRFKNVDVPVLCSAWDASASVAPALAPVIVSADTPS